MNATVDRTELKRALARLPREGKQPIPLRVIAGADGLLLLTPTQRDFVLGMVLVSGEFLTSLGLFRIAVRIHRCPTLTLQANEKDFSFGPGHYKAINYRRTDDVSLDPAD